MKIVRIAPLIISASFLAACGGEKVLVQQEAPVPNPEAKAYRPLAKAINWYSSPERMFLVEQGIQDLTKLVNDSPNKERGDQWLVIGEDLLTDQSRLYQQMAAEQFAPTSDKALNLSMERPNVSPAMKDLLQLCSQQRVNIVLITHKSERYLQSTLDMLTRLGVQMAEPHMHLRLVDGIIENEDAAAELRSDRVIGYGVSNLNDLQFLQPTAGMDYEAIRQFQGSYGHRIVLVPNPAL